MAFFEDLKNDIHYRLSDRRASLYRASINCTVTFILLIYYHFFSKRKEHSFLLYAVEPHLPHITRMIPHSSNIPCIKTFFWPKVYFEVFVFLRTFFLAQAYPSSYKSVSFFISVSIRSTSIGFSGRITTILPCLPIALPNQAVRCKYDNVYLKPRANEGIFYR